MSLSRVGGVGDPMGVTQPRTLAVSTRELDAMQRDYNAHHADRVAARFAEHATWSDPFVSRLDGRKAIGETLQALFVAFPDMQYRLTSTLVTADTAVLLYEGSASFRGPLDMPGMPPVAPTGKKATWRGALVLRYQGGQIVAGLEAFDAEDFARQAGLPLPPA